jgi:hypothetical protein
VSYYDYAVSRVIAAQDFPVASLIMAAMRKTDTANSAKLRRAFPEVWDELLARYHAPGGRLEGEER